MKNIGNIIKRLQNTMRQDPGVAGDAQRIAQLTWLFVLKILDDKEQEMEIIEFTYHSPIPSRLRWRNWAADDEGITGDELHNFVNNQLFPGLKELDSIPRWATSARFHCA